MPALSPQAGHSKAEVPGQKMLGEAWTSEKPRAATTNINNNALRTYPWTFNLLYFCAFYKNPLKPLLSEGDKDGPTSSPLYLYVKTT